MVKINLYPKKLRVTVIAKVKATVTTKKVNLTQIQMMSIQPIKGRRLMISLIKRQIIQPRKVINLKKFLRRSPKKEPNNNQKKIKKKPRH